MSDDVQENKNASLMRPLNVFYCYARKDRKLRDELDKHLSIMRWQGQITTWHDREIQAGKEWEWEITAHLNMADIILLLVSPNFVKSDYCYGVEMRQALERHRAGKAYVIPIILRPVDFQKTPIGKIQELPLDGKPISTWRNRDEAFQDVVRGVQELVETHFSWKNRGSKPSHPNYPRYQGDMYDLDSPSSRAIRLFGQALRSTPTSFIIDGEAPRSVLKRILVFNRIYPGGIVDAYGELVTNYNEMLALCEQALAAYNQVIQVDSKNAAGAYRNKGIILWCLQHYDEGLSAFEQALQLNPSDLFAYYGRGRTLESLGNLKEAQQIYLEIQSFEHEAMQE